MGQAASQNDDAEPDQEDDEIIPMRADRFLVSFHSYIFHSWLVYNTRAFSLFLQNFYATIVSF